MSRILDKVKKLDSRYSGIRLENAYYYKSSKRLEVNFILGVHFDESDERVISACIAEELPFAVVNATI